MNAVLVAGSTTVEDAVTRLFCWITIMPYPTQLLRPPEPVAPAEKGRWLVLIGDEGETDADEIEAFFAEMWPEVAAEAETETEAQRTGALFAESASTHRQSAAFQRVWKGTK